MDFFELQKTKRGQAPPAFLMWGALLATRIIAVVGVYMLVFPTMAAPGSYYGYGAPGAVQVPPGVDLSKVDAGATCNTVQTVPIPLDAQDSNNPLVNISGMAILVYEGDFKTAISASAKLADTGNASVRQLKTYTYYVRGNGNISDLQTAVSSCDVAPVSTRHRMIDPAPAFSKRNADDYTLNTNAANCTVNANSYCTVNLYATRSQAMKHFAGVGDWYFAGLNVSNSTQFDTGKMVDGQNTLGANGEACLPYQTMFDPATGATMRATTSFAPITDKTFLIGYWCKGNYNTAGQAKTSISVYGGSAFANNNVTFLFAPVMWFKNTNTGQMELGVVDNTGAALGWAAFWNTTAYFS